MKEIPTSVNASALPAISESLVHLNPRRREWTVLEDCVNDTPYVVLTKGYVSNGASIPRLVWWLIDPLDLGIVPPVVHDRLYDGDVCDRATADRALLALMKAADTVWWRRTLAYYVVRLLGGSHWGKR